MSPKTPLKIFLVVGTRPNFIKITQFRRVAKSYPQFDLCIVHTGQHYDDKMADVFFEQFGLRPDHFLNIPAASPNTQMAEIMLRLEKLVADENPSLIMVTGDVNTTLAAAITANKMNIRLAHIESGLRSFDRSMPEEFNRVLTDELSDFLFVTEPSGLQNLENEGVDASKVFFVGNTMIDTMVAFADSIEASPVLDELHLSEKQFVLMTMHRPATVDTREGLEKLLQLIQFAAQHKKIVFPIHPRTVSRLEQFALMDDFRSCENLVLTEPLDYFAFQKLVRTSAYIITDSGGIQEESTFAQVPCLTLRPNTERPVTISIGTNELLPFDISLIEKRIEAIESGKVRQGRIPEKWDGKATERIFAVLAEKL